MPAPIDFFQPFARAISAKAEFLRDHPKLSKLPQQRILESISDDIKKVSNFLVPQVSIAAATAAKVLAPALNRTLDTKNWHDQPSFDKKRKIFHFEHVMPVAEIRRQCLDSPDETSVLEILKTKLRVAWILKEEDARLTRLGFRSKRPEPDEAYRAAEIILLPPQS